jgi:hypothetical protein
VYGLNNPYRYVDPDGFAPSPVNQELREQYVTASINKAQNVARKIVLSGAMAVMEMGVMPSVSGVSVAKGARSVYRQGTFADEAANWGGNYVKGKQWAGDNPLTTTGYAKKYGLPAENTGKPDWVVKGRVDGNYVIRPAPASHNNPSNKGGGTEIIPGNPNNVKLDWFHMPD